MQIHELYEYKAHYERDIIEGRWWWAQTMAVTWDNPIDQLPPFKNSIPTFSERFQTNLVVGRTIWKGIKWVDLFGKHPITYFTFNETWRTYSMLPLSRRFLIFQYRHRMLKLVELDWKTSDVLVGGTFSSFKKSLGNLEDAILIDDSLYSNGDVQFLIHVVEDRIVYCLHCRVNSTTRRIETIGQKSELPREEFNFMDLRGNIIRGLSTTGTITQFNLRKRQKLPSIELNGIPPNISSNTIAWSNDRLFVAEILEDGELEIDTPEYENFKITIYHSIIYDINLENGNIVALSVTIDGRIERMKVGLDGHLYLSTMKLLPEMTGLETKHCETRGIAENLILYRHLRIPIRQPESLFLLAVAALPRPIPLAIYKMIRKRDDAPMQLCNCQFIDVNM